MSTKVKTKTNGALAIITLVFAIIAAAFLGLAAVWNLLGSGLIFIADLVFPILFNGNLSLGFVSWITLILTIINLAFRVITPLIYILILAAAAVLLIVNRRGSLLFIPMGLLAGMAFASPISSVVNTIGNILISRLGINAAIVNSYLGGIPSYVASMAVAVVFAVIFFLLAATLFKKLRPIPMAIISVVLGVGLVVRVGTVLLSLISNMEYYNLVFSGYLDASHLYNIITSFMASVSGCFTQLLVCVASVFAIVAVIPYKKKVAVEENAETDGVIETVAEEVVAEDVATEEVATEAPVEPAAE